MAESPLRFTHSPGMPLFPLSPERVNSVRAHPSPSPASLPPSAFIKTSEFTLNPGSPSMSRHSQLQQQQQQPQSPQHSRNNSEALVQGMVARFDSLSLKDHAQMHRRDEAALRREQIAREAAELELGRVRLEREELEAEGRRGREECRRLKKEVEEGRERDRKLVKRLAAQEDVLERSTQTHEHQKTLLEKEVRKLRKEAYKTQSALLKSQEDLKGARNSLKVAHSGLEAEKQKSFKREQEAFTAEYKLVGLLEEVAKLQDRLKIVEEEKNALKTNLQEEEVARIAAEGRIALPVAVDGEVDEFSTPKMSPRKRLLEHEDKENVTPRRTVRSAEMAALQEEVERQRKMRVRAEDQVEFMKMECQFQCCSCRVAEQQGLPYLHDDQFAMETTEAAADDGDLMEVLSTRDAEVKTPEVEQNGSMAQPMEERVLDELPDMLDVEMSTSPTPAKVKMELSKDVQSEPETQGASVAESSVALEEESEATILKHPVPSCLASDLPFESDDLPRGADEVEDDHHRGEEVHPQTPRGPQTPRYREIRTVTTTTTIPLSFSPSSDPVPAEDFGHAPQTPATVGHAPSSKVPASPFPNTPGALRPDGTLDRAAALEQIRLRRGRARSVAMGLATPNKQMVEGVVRRDISAPALKARG